MSLDLLFLVTVLVVALVAGFGWSAGCWLFGKLLH